MLEVLGELLLYAVTLLFFLTGKAVIAIVSLGRWRVESWGESESRIHAPAGAWSFTQNGRRICTTSSAFCAGFLFYMLLILLAAWLWLS